MKNGTDLWKRGTVPIISVKKYPCCFMNRKGPIDPIQHGYFFTKRMGTIPLFNLSVPDFTCSANGPLVTSEILAIPG